MTDPYAAYQQPTPPPRRSRVGVLVVAVGAAVALLAIAILVPAWVATRMNEDRRAVQAEATLDEVEVFEDLRSDHVEGPIDYDRAPPAGGPHHPAWLECGVYEEPVPNEPTVHSLEHGTIWLTYDPELSGRDVAALRRLVPDDGILSPYRGLPAPVVVTVWGRQLRLEGAGDPRLPLFIEEYGDGSTSPEPMVGCRGGLTLEQAKELFSGESV